MPEQGSVVTFYSYKGGVGRTMALAGVAAQLAQWGYRVLCIDWDLEAPGLDGFFAPWLEPKRIRRGVVDLAETFARRSGRVDWRACCIDLALPATKVPITFLPAGLQDERYMGRVQKLDWNHIYDRGFGRYLEEIRSEWTRDFEFVLVDSRTGASDTGGICTIQLPSLLVVLFTASEQSVEGIRRVALRAQQQQAKLPLDRARLLVVPVPTRMDPTEYKLRERWHGKIARSLGTFVDEWAGEKSLSGDVLRQLAIPYVPYWSYGERIPVVDESSRDKLGVGFAHETLAALIAHELSGIVDLLRNREAFVREASTGHASIRARAAEVFLSYDRTETRLTRKLADELRARGRGVWLDTGRIRGGEVWERELTDAMRASASVVILVGRRVGQWQKFELNEALRAALGEEKRIIPVIRRGVPTTEVPRVIRGFKGLREDAFRTTAELADAIVRRLTPVSGRARGASTPRSTTSTTSRKRRATRVARGRGEKAKARKK